MFWFANWCVYLTGWWSCSLQAYKLHVKIMRWSVRPGMMSVEAGISNVLPFLSLSGVTWHSPFLLLIYRITLTRFVTQIGILWQWPQGLNAVFAKRWLVPPLFHPPPFSIFSLFSPLCRGPKPAKHISKWQLLRLSSKNLELWIFLA